MGYLGVQNYYRCFSPEEILDNHRITIPSCTFLREPIISLFLSKETMQGLVRKGVTSQGLNLDLQIQSGFSLLLKQGTASAFSQQCNIKDCTQRIRWNWTIQHNGCGKCIDGSHIISNLVKSTVKIKSVRKLYVSVFFYVAAIQWKLLWEYTLGTLGTGKRCP